MFAELTGVVSGLAATGIGICVLEVELRSGDRPRLNWTASF